MASFDLLAYGRELTDEGIASLALLLSGLLLLGSRHLGSLQSFFSFSPRIGHGCNASRQSSDILSGRCQLTGKDFTSLALLLSGLLLLGSRHLGSLQSFFSFSPRIGHGCNASRQSSDILSGRCQLLLSGRGSLRTCDCFASFDLLARGCEVTNEGIASLALLFQRSLLLGGRSPSSICGRLATFGLLARGCEVTNEGIASLALLFQR